jgi:hypothetical protein
MPRGPQTTGLQKLENVFSVQIEVSIFIYFMVHGYLSHVPNYCEFCYEQMSEMLRLPTECCR